MANRSKSVAENVPGEFYVDSSCIDCDTCRQLAPSVFEDTGETSFVKNQPDSPDRVREALQALLACPTGSIGTLGPNAASEVRGDFPLPLEDGVFYCGFNSPKSFGGNSYFLRHPDGNWLVDSPKFLPHLVGRFEEAGGLKYIFLTHQDDVADAGKYAEKFGAKRILHEADLEAEPGVEIVVRGFECQDFAPEFRILPTPGHTEGHCVLLYREKFLFTGDHLYWRRKSRQLGAFRNATWFSWRRQAESMERLLRHRFEWVLPGHGDRVKLPAKRMRKELEDLVNRMKTSLEGHQNY